MARKARRPRPAKKRAGRKAPPKSTSSRRVPRAKRTAKPRRPPRKKTARRSVKLPKPAKRSARPVKPVPKRARTAASPRKPAPRRDESAPILDKTPHLNRPRRILNEETLPSLPSSLNLDARPSAARSGREEMRHHAGRTALASSINAGDSDVNPETAYFTGDETPGGDNPSPDQDVVEEIGKALGVEYHDAEELRGSDKIADRDKHRWELDPASSEDYKGRK